MDPRLTAMPAANDVDRRPATERHPRRDDRWARQMTRLLREAAEARDKRERARASQDESEARRESAAIMALILAHGRPNIGTASHVQPRDERRHRRS
jgi:hypothetical protein